MSLKVQRQDNLDKLFDKFAIGPDDKDKLTTKAVQDTIDEHAKRKENKAADKRTPINSSQKTQWQLAIAFLFE
ncbi:SPJ_0845 family protein [Lactiplantibacillus plantarum]|nr:SPJ_0845 family protein [Lactiplantibacillus plantarum]